MSIELKNKIEEEKAAEKLKTELITNISHDLRTPLTSLIGYLQLVTKPKISSEAKNTYSKISLEKSVKLKTLIDDLFEYSKLESGYIKLDRTMVNIVELIEQSIGELSLETNKKHIVFNKNFNFKNIKLSVDPNKMARVFTNIISNAVKYSIPCTAININLYHNDHNVIISFENTVDTVFEEELESLFNRFYRTNASINSQIDGSGLGLAIAKNIVELHEGKIWANSNVNSFTITIELGLLINPFVPQA